MVFLLPKAPSAGPEMTFTIILPCPAVLGLPSSIALASEALPIDVKRAMAVANPISSSSSVGTSSASFRSFAKRSIVRNDSGVVLFGNLRSSRVVGDILLSFALDIRRSTMAAGFPLVVILKT